MAKVAILLSGFVRDHRLDSLKEFVIDPNLAAGNEVDLYVSTWDTRGTVTTTDAHDTVFTGREYWSGDVRTYDNSPIDKGAFRGEISRVAPGRSAVRFNSYESQARDWLTKMPNKDKGLARGKDEHTILRIKGMWFGLNDVFSMIPDPNAYDFIVRSRLDIRFKEQFTFGCRRSLLRKRKNVATADATYLLDAQATLEGEHVDRVKSRLPGIPPPRCSMLVPVRDNSYVDDWFAVGDAASMSVHMTAFCRLDHYLTEMHTWPEPYESESITVLNALQGGVNLVGFPKTMYQ